jgi:hypothetical protein
MGNIFKEPKKLINKKRLFDIGAQALEKDGWTVEREDGRSSVCKIRKGDVSKTISLITTQDQWMSYRRTDDNSKWLTLSDVDDVVVVTVDDRDNPRNANVHYFNGNEVRTRFDRAYTVRAAAGHSQPTTHGIWVGLYAEDAVEPPSYAGAGIGLKFPPIAVVPLEETQVSTESSVQAATEEAPLTIPEAKRRLAITFGVLPENIKITVEG